MGFGTGPPDPRRGASCHLTGGPKLTSPAAQDKRQGTLVFAGPTLMKGNSDTETQEGHKLEEGRPSQGSPAALSGGYGVILSSFHEISGQLVTTW